MSDAKRNAAYPEWAQTILSRVQTTPIEAMAKCRAFYEKWFDSRNDKMILLLSPEDAELWPTFVEFIKQKDQKDQQIILKTDWTKVKSNERPDPELVRAMLNYASSTGPWPIPNLPPNVDLRGLYLAASELWQKELPKSLFLTEEKPDYRDALQAHVVANRINYGVGWRKDNTEKQLKVKVPPKDPHHSQSLLDHAAIVGARLISIGNPLPNHVLLEHYRTGLTIAPVQLR